MRHDASSPLIAIDATSALAQGGGIGRFTRGLLLGLAELGDGTPYRLGYARDAAGERPALPTNFQWQPLPLSQKQATWLWHRLALPLAADRWFGRPALLHGPDYVLPPLGAARGVVTIHDLSYEALPDVHVPRLRRYLQRAVPRSIQRADHLFADSHSSKEAVVRYYGTDPAKISVIYPGIEPRFRPFDRADAADAAQLEAVRARFQLHRPFVLGLGTLEPRKNFATLVRAFATYRREVGGEVELLIAGGGGWLGQREALEALIVAEGLRGHARLLGFVPDDGLPALLNLAHTLAYPSLYEGFGLPVLEALACGLPTITARNSSLPEAGGEAARYVAEARDAVALAEALHVVLHDEAERSRMRAAGLAHAARFTWGETARQVRARYEQLLRGE